MNLDFWLQVLMVAVLFDIIPGEPPSIIHPVVWMGKPINLFVQKAPVSHRKMYGFFMVFFCTGAAVLTGLAIVSLGNGLLNLLIARLTALNSATRPSSVYLFDSYAGMWFGLE